MVSVIELEKLAEARLNDAEALYRTCRYDGAAYVCGYAIELKLKSRICKALHWKGYPSSAKEFENYKSFKTHKFDILLSFTTFESKIKSEYIDEWSNVCVWNPEFRYKKIGSMTQLELDRIIQSTKVLLKII